MNNLGSVGILNTSRDGTLGSQTSKSDTRYIKEEREFFTWYPNTEKWYAKHEGVFYLVYKHREVIYHTRERLLYMISKHREVILKHE